MEIEDVRGNTCSKTKARKVMWLVIVILLPVIMIVAITWYKTLRPLDFEYYYKRITGQISLINQINERENKFLKDDYSEQHGEKHIVKDFDYKINILPFGNLPLLEDKEDGGEVGICAGYSIFLSKLFNNTLEPVGMFNGNTVYNVTFIKDGDMSKYKIDQQGYYNLSTDKVQNSKTQSKSKNLMSIYGDTLNKDIAFIDKGHLDIRVSEIIKAMEYYQVLSQLHFNTVYLPGRFKDKEAAIDTMEQENYYNGFFQRYKPDTKVETTETLSIDKILNEINNDRLLPIGLREEDNIGHAVLAYGYEKLDINTYKIYIIDNNLVNPIPFLQLTETENEDILNRSYIVFKKNRR